MWSKPIHISTEVDALILDCEGINSDSRPYDIGVKVFALCLLLSSQLVFNSKGTITDTTLEDLGALLLMANEIRINVPDLSG